MKILVTAFLFIIIVVGYLSPFGNSLERGESIKDTSLRTFDKLSPETQKIIINFSEEIIKNCPDPVFKYFLMGLRGIEE